MRPENVTDGHLRYLDNLRDSGETNMFGAAQYLASTFGLSTKEARGILVYWMQTYGERHPQEETR